MLTGCVATGNIGINEMDIFVYKVEMTNLTVVSSTTFDSQNFGNYNLVDWPRNTAVCPNISGTENFNDVAQSIVQNVNGDFLLAGQYNWQHALTNAACINVSNPETPCHVREQIEASDGMLIMVDDNLNTLAETHIGRFEGDDFWFSAKFDYSGNIYALGTTANPDRTLDDPGCSINTQKCQDNFMLVKADFNSTTNVISYQWHKEFYGGAKSSSCGFDLTIDKDNNVICVGNNHYQHENWDIVKISNDCAINSLSSIEVDLEANSPNGIFSVKKHMDAKLPAGQTVWTIGSDKVIKAQILVEDGYTLKIPYDWGVKIEFCDARLLEDNFEANNAYNSSAGIVVATGGTLVLKGGTELTSLNTSCFNTWGGVQIGGNLFGGGGGDFLMENSTISNARVGLKVFEGDIEAYNTTLPTNTTNPLDYNTAINFVNNDISVFYPASVYNVKNIFKLLNFECNDRTSYSSGMDYFIKFRNDPQFGQGLKIEGCEFKNTYFNSIGMCTGISSFGGGLDVLFADLGQGTSGCRPTTPRLTKFSGLYTAIANGYTTHSQNQRMRVAEVDFDNNKQAIIDGVGVNSFIWKNNIHWDDRVFPLQFDPGTTLGIFNSWGWGTEILENEISNTHDGDFLAIYTEQNAWHSSYGGQNVTGNTIENAYFNPTNLGTGHKISGDNLHMQITCNTYSGLYNDWYVTGDLPTQEINGDHNKNIWSNWGGFQFSDIQDVSSNGFIYYGSNPSSADPNVTKYYPYFSSATIDDFNLPFGECSPKDPCNVYAPAGEGWGIIASQVQVDHPVDILLSHLFGGDADQAEKLLEKLEVSDVYDGLEDLVTSLLSASKENRLYRLKGNEIKALKQIAAKSSYTGQLAKDVLFHFSDIRSTLDTYTGERLPEDELIERTATDAKVEFIEKVKLYPNPATDKLNIQTAGSESYSADVLDLSGKLIHTFEGTSNTAVDISSLAVGVYFIQVSTAEGISVHKLIIE
jgi:hypothetical protein